MPNPIQSNQASSVGYYDNEHGECRPIDASTPNASTRSEMSVATEPRPTQSKAVDKLVNSATKQGSKKCARDVVEAAASCVGAVGGALASPSGVGVVVVLAAAANCGAKIADAEVSCRE